MEIIQSKKVDGVVVASFNKDVKKFNALITEDAKSILTGFFEKPNTNLILDLNGINYVDSSGFGVFLSLMKRANNNYGYFKICNVSPDVMELFKLLQLHNVFEICDNLEDCLNSFKK